MSNKVIIIILAVILVFLIGLQQYVIRNSPKEDPLLEQIIKLESKIDSLNTKKDSIREVIDSTHIKIITNEQHYQERITTIISQPTDSDYRFVADYIRQHRSQRNSDNIR